MAAAVRVVAVAAVAVLGVTVVVVVVVVDGADAVVLVIASFVRTPKNSVNFRSEEHPHCPCARVCSAQRYKIHICCL